MGIIEDREIPDVEAKCKNGVYKLSNKIVGEE